MLGWYRQEPVAKATAGETDVPFYSVLVLWGVQGYVNLGLLLHCVFLQPYVLHRLARLVQEYPQQEQLLLSFFIEEITTVTSLATRSMTIARSIRLLVGDGRAPSLRRSPSL